MSKVKSYIIADIIKGLERGRLPWQYPAIVSGFRNGATGKRYSVINSLWLASQVENTGREADTYYLTIKQVNALGGSVNTGAKCFYVCFYSMLEKDGEEEKTFPFLRYYRVFALRDTNIPREKIIATHEKDKPAGASLIERAEAVVIKTGAVIEHNSLTLCSYSPVLDRVAMHPRETFLSTGAYYSTLFHELTHWTGHASRLNRQLEKYSFDKEVRSKEEIVAELGSAFLMAELGIATPETSENTQAYINSWVSYLTKHPDEIVSAASKSEKAVRYILAGGKEETK